MNLPCRLFILAATACLLPLAAETLPAGLGSSWTLTGYVSGRGELKGPGGNAMNVAIGGFAATAGQPVCVISDSLISVGMQYEMISIGGENGAGNGLPLPTRLQSVAATFSLHRRLAPPWGLSVAVIPGLHDAGTSLSSKGFGLGARLVFFKQASPTLDYGFGLVYNSLSHDYRLFPGFGLNWKPAGRWTATLGFPKTSVAYGLSEAVRLSLALSGEGGTYHVREVRWSQPVSQPLADSTLEYAEGRIGLALEWKAAPGLAVEISGGAVLGRRFEYVARNFRMRAHGPTPFAAIAVRGQF